MYIEVKNFFMCPLLITKDCLDENKKFIKKSKRVINNKIIGVCELDGKLLTAKNIQTKTYRNKKCRYKIYE